MPDKAYVVYDAEREIENNADPDTHQLDLVHAIRDTLFMMWMDNATKNERDRISDRMKEILLTLEIL
mgnify:CR=1 FL=1